MKDFIYSVAVVVTASLVTTAIIHKGPALIERVKRWSEGPMFNEGDTVSFRKSKANPWRKQ